MQIISECIELRCTDCLIGNIAHIFIDALPLLSVTGRDTEFLFDLLNSADPL